MNGTLMGFYTPGQSKLENKEILHTPQMSKIKLILQMNQ